MADFVITDASIDRNKGGRGSKLMKLVPKTLQLQDENLECQLQINKLSLIT